MNKKSPSVQNKETASDEFDLSFLRTLSVGTSVRYTLIALGALLIHALGLATGYVDALRFFLFLPFACLLTAAAMIRRAPRLGRASKAILHPILVLGGFYLCLYLPYQLRTKPSNQQVLLIVLLAAILYAAAMGIYLACTRRRRQKAIDETPYVSQFGKK